MITFQIYHTGLFFPFPLCFNDTKSISFENSWNKINIRKKTVQNNGYTHPIWQSAESDFNILGWCTKAEWFLWCFLFVFVLHLHLFIYRHKKSN